MISSIKYYYTRFGINGLISAIKTKLDGVDRLIQVSRKDLKAPFYLRLRTSDIPTFDQIFINKEYLFKTSNDPKVIVDAGANIGLSTIFFANKYPESKIIAIEPENDNFKILKMNVSPYTNVIPLQAALWNKNKEINLVDPGQGNWGFTTEKKKGGKKLWEVMP